MRHNRRRTALTMLGMAWGIATVVLLLAYGAGFGRAIEVIFANWGTRIIGVFPGRTSMQAGGQKAGVQIKFTIDDIDRIVAAAPLVNRITPEVDKQISVQRDVRTYDLPIQGVYPSMFQILALNLGEGRLLNEEDEASRGRVAVISSDAKLKLFSGEYAIGQHVRIGGISYQVVGVLTPHMQEGDDSVNKTIYIPFSTMSDFKDTHYLDGIWISYEGNDYELVEKQVRGALAKQYNFNPDDKRAVFLYNMMKQLKQFGIIITGLKVLLGFIGTLDAGHRRRGADEHHAGVGDAAHARDRRGEGAGRPAARHSLPVPGRSAGHHLRRRNCRHCSSLRRLHWSRTNHFLQCGRQERRGG